MNTNEKIKINAKFLTSKNSCSNEKEEKTIEEQTTTDEINCRAKRLRGGSQKGFAIRQFTFSTFLLQVFFICSPYNLPAILKYATSRYTSLAIKKSLEHRACFWGKFFSKNLTHRIHSNVNISLYKSFAR